MYTAANLLAMTFLAHSGSSTVTPEMRALHAIEHAAQAAQSAAEAAARAAAAAEKLAGGKPAAAGEAPAAPAAGTWDTSVGASLIWLAGNSKTLTVGLNAQVERKTEHWIFSAKATGAYGQTTLPDTNIEQTTALGGALGLRVDRRFTPTITAYIAPLAETDRVKDMDYRLSAEAGSGITWLEEKEDGDFLRLSLRTDLGLRVSEEHRFKFFPVEMEIPDDMQPETIVAPRLGIAFKYNLSKDVGFTEEIEVLPNLLDPRVLLNSNSKLSVRLTSILSFAVSLLLAHDTKPAEGREKTDSTLSLGLQVSL